MSGRKWPYYLCLTSTIWLLKAVISRVEIELPPISEQSRIATFRYKADELRAKRKRTLEMLNNLVATIFAEMFGNLIRNEKGWKVVSVGDFVARFEGGKNVAAEDENNKLSAYRVLKVSAVNDH